MKKNAAYYIEDLSRLVEVSKKELLEWESEEPYYQPIKYLIEKKNEMLGLPMYDSRVASAAHNIEELRAEEILTDDPRDIGKDATFLTQDSDHAPTTEATSPDGYKEQHMHTSEDNRADDVDTVLGTCESDASSSDTVRNEEKACEITTTRGIDLYTKTTNETQLESDEIEESIASLSDDLDDTTRMDDTNEESIQDSDTEERSSVELASGSEEVVDRLGLSLYTSKEPLESTTDESINEEITDEDTEEEAYTPVDHGLETEHITSMYDLRASSSEKDEKKSKKKKDKKKKDKKQKKKDECKKAKSKKTSKSKPKKKAKSTKATDVRVIQESEARTQSTTETKPLDIDFLAWLRSKSIERLEDEKAKKGKKKKKDKKKKKKSKEQKLIKEANRSTYRDTTVISETLAKILADQGHKSEAIEMYEQLSLLITEKSTYFAAKIKELKNS